MRLPSPWQASAAPCAGYPSLGGRARSGETEPGLSDGARPTDATSARQRSANRPGRHRDRTETPGSVIPMSVELARAAQTASAERIGRLAEDRPLLIDSC